MGGGLALAWGFAILWFAEDFSVREGIGVARPERLMRWSARCYATLRWSFAERGFGSDDVAGQSCCYDHP